MLIILMVTFNFSSLGMPPTCCLIEWTWLVLLSQKLISYIAASSSNIFPLTLKPVRPLTAAMAACMVGKRT